MSNPQTNTLQPYKIVFHHADKKGGEYFEMENEKGELRRYSRDQVEAIKKLMNDWKFQTIVFRDYSLGPMKAYQHDTRVSLFTDSACCSPQFERYQHLQITTLVVI